MKNIQTATERKIALIQARDEWDARNAEQKAKYEAQYAAFSSKQTEIFDDIKGQVLAALHGIDLNLEVEVDSGFSIRRNSVQVRVKSNENRVHAEDKALSWTWDVSLGENGSVNKSSGSWSGLQATTAEQIESLKATARTLEILNNIDWASMLNVTLSEWSEHVTEKSSIGDRPKFEADIRVAEIAELIGTNALIKGSPSGGRGRGTAWYLIISKSPKQFRVAEIAGYSIEEQSLTAHNETIDIIVQRAKNWPTGISKEKFIKDIVGIGKPLETLEF